DLIELYRGYGDTFFLDRCYDLRVHQSPSTSSVVLEYSSEGRVVANGQPYGNRYISVVVINDRKVTAWRDYLDPLRVFAALVGRPFEPSARPCDWLPGDEVFDERLPAIGESIGSPRRRNGRGLRCGEVQQHWAF
ncbi:MAG: uncharacterized protein QOI01_765, partial [Mycobacterium sp.]|nr:uncharacterized protein [Mycobacterium sp.]